MKKILSKTIISLLICLSILLSSVYIIPVEAKTQIKKGSVYLEKEDDDEIEFSLKKDSALYFDFDLELFSKSSGKERVDVYIEGNDSDYNTIFEDEFTIKFSKNESKLSWFYFPDEILHAGDYQISFGTNKDVDVKYKITSYNNYAEKVKIPKSFKIKTDTEKTFKMKNISPSKSLIGSQWKSSNKKIATVFNDGRSDKVYVYGVKAGKCTLTCILINGKKYKCKVTVKDPSKPKISYKKLFLNKGDKFKLKLKFRKKKKVKWYSTNTKIATVSKKGNVKAKAEGKCKIIAKCKGKKYTCKVKVYRNNPNFTAIPISYNTRNNYFTIKFKNYGKYKVKIKSSGAYCMDVDYKSYDRKLRLKNYKDITIKAKSSKKIKFYVIGNLTWYNYRDFTYRYYFTYDGYKYLGSCWDYGTVYKEGKHWYDTFWKDYEPDYDY